MNGQTQYRPKWVEDAVARLGADLGRETLGFNDAGHIALELDEVALTLTWAGERVGIVLRAPLSLPAGTGAGAMATLHGANAQMAMAGLGMIVCDTGAGTWAWIDRIETAAIGEAHLFARLEAAVAAVRVWTEALPDLCAGEAAGGGNQTDTAPAHGGDTHIHFKL